MIGKEDKEEVVLVVNDRRKFNTDGSVREGVVIEEAPKREEKTAPAEKAEEPQAAIPEIGEAAQTGAGAEMAEDDEDYPDAENPASFVNFLSTLASQAAASLGAMPHPATGQRTLDLESGKYWIDVLGMIKEKTSGNLHPKEDELLTGLLADLKMQFVQINRMAEERMKQQAAQKFSGSDLIGKK